MPATPAAPSRRIIAGYAVGSVGTGGFGTLPGLVLGYYLTDTLGVAAGLAGLVVTVPKIWDVVIDPFIGQLSDRSALRTGTRRPLLLAGALLLPVAFLAIFAVPAPLGPAAAAIWVTVAFVSATTAFSLFQVPYIALPAQLTAHAGDPHRARTRLLAPRIAVLAVAILAFGAGGPLIRDAVAGPRLGYLVMAAITGVVMGLGMLISAKLTTPATARGQRASVAPAHQGGPEIFAWVTVRSGWRVLQQSAALRRLLTAFTLQALATGAMLAAAQYVATYTLGEESAVTVLFVALVAPALVVMPLARRVADRIGKQRALMASAVLFAVATASLMLMTVRPGAWVYLSVALAGVAYAGMQLYPLAMLPDIIAEHSSRHRDEAGVMSGVWTAAETAGLAVGPSLALGILALTGFVSRTGGAVAAQPDSALLGVVMIFSLLPAGLTLASLIPLSRYRLADNLTR